ncbi:serine hydrolase domain-containing protein [Cystobacter fuscus]
MFKPLGMKDTTFDFARALRRNHASPHGWDVDGRTVVEKMDRNYAVVPVRPAGGVWTSVRDLSRYVQLELARGALPDGTRLVSEESLLARYAPQVSQGEDVTYGMGLVVDRTWGATVVHHGGGIFGYTSDMLWLPEAGVGAVVLTNADSGPFMLGAFMRRLLEVLYDGRPEAEEDVKAQAQTLRAEIQRARERLTLPPDPEAVRALAPRYHSDALGDLAVRTGRDGRTMFDLGEWSTAVATRKEEDGSLTFVGIEPGKVGMEFVVTNREGRRALVVRDGQHEYVFIEVAPER